MYRVELVLGIAVAIAWIYSIVTCALTPEDEVRGLPKWGWLILIVLLPLLGSVLWIGVGRQRSPRAFRPVGPSSVSAPHGYSAMAGDERIRRMEEDLARLERESEEGDPGSRSTRA